MLVHISSSFAAETDGLCMIAVTDSHNERISGAAIELSGVNKVFYTNINGYCYIPKSLLAKAGRVTINSISYKTIFLNSDDLRPKVVLESR